MTNHPTLRNVFELGRKHGQASELAKYDPRRDERQQTVAELLAETEEIIADFDRRRWARAHGLHPANLAADRAELAPVVSLADRRPGTR